MPAWTPPIAAPDEKGRAVRGEPDQSAESTPTNATAEGESRHCACVSVIVCDCVCVCVRA